MDRTENVKLHSREVVRGQASVELGSPRPAQGRRINIRHGQLAGRFGRVGHTLAAQPTARQVHVGGSGHGTVAGNGVAADHDHCIAAIAPRMPSYGKRIKGTEIVESPKRAKILRMVVGYQVRMTHQLECTIVKRTGMATFCL